MKEGNRRCEVEIEREEKGKNLPASGWGRRFRRELSIREQEDHGNIPRVYP